MLAKMWWSVSQHAARRLRFALGLPCEEVQFAHWCLPQGRTWSHVHLQRKYIGTVKGALWLTCFQNTLLNYRPYLFFFRHLKLFFCWTSSLRWKLMKKQIWSCSFWVLSGLGWLSVTVMIPGPTAKSWAVWAGSKVLRNITWQVSSSEKLLVVVVRR